MSYPKNAASPPKLFASIVNATTGAAITSGVAAKYSTGTGSQGAGAGTCQHEGNGQWSYAPTQAETNVDAFGVQFYHADAVGSGPTISVVTNASVVQTGDAYAVVAHADYGNAKLVRSTTPANTLDVSAGGEASANVTYSAGVALGGPLAEASDLPSVAGLALEATAQAILEDTGTTLPAAIAGIGAGGGLYSETITIKDTLDNPLDGVLVHVATDSAFANIVRSGYTNNMGQVALNFDTTGTYYGRAEIAGYGISVFDVEVTA